jgi:hypothetical protein
MLLVDARAAHERLQSAEAARANLDEANALVGLHKELAGKAARLGVLVARANLLRERGVPLVAGPDTDPMRKSVTNLLTRFNTSPTSRTLTQGKHWTGLLAALDGMVATLEANQRHGWSDYFATRLFTGLPPEQRRVGLVQALPANKLAMEQYTRLYEKLTRYRTTVPSTAQALDEVHECSDALAQIRFEEDVPKEVEAFINAVPQGASLGLLTAGVIEWLREHELLGSFVVRARP